MYEKSERKKKLICNSFQNIEYKKKISIGHNRFRAPIESDQTTYRSIFCRKELMWSQGHSINLNKKKN